MKIKPIFFILFFSSLHASSSYAFFCPNGFNQISFGDSAAQVEQACGKPDKTVTTDAPDTSPQEWNYYIPQQTSMNPMIQAHQGEASLKATFAFDGQGKLVNISVNGIGVSSASNCGSPVSIGDTQKQVEAACGKPSFVVKQTPSSGQSADTPKQVEWTYSSPKPAKLIFRNGTLADMQ